MNRWLARWRRLRALGTDATLSLTARPFRTVAMMAGIMLAAASASTAIVIADTQQIQIDRRFDLQRSAAVVIHAQSAPQGFDPKKLAAVATLEPVSDAGELSIWAETTPVALNRWGSEANAPIVVADRGGLSAAASTVNGMDPHNLSLDQPLVWVGHRLARRLGLVDLRSPQTILLLHRQFGVAGLVTAKPGFEYLDTSLIMGRRPAAALVPAGRTIRAVAAVRPGAAHAVAEYAMAALDPQRTLDLVDVTPPDGEQLLSNVAADLRLLGLALGGFVGLIGIVAVANTMSMSVTQRTRELGLRSAMGWTPGRIRLLILIEAATAGLYASIVGCAIGVAIALSWVGSQGWQPVVSKALPAIVISTGTFAAIAGGLLPAQRAARISPLVAMRT